MRGTQIEIRPSALTHNARIARQHAEHCELFAMVKANAYGHGIDVAWRAFAPVVDGFGVAVCDEAQQLRTLGCSHPIMVAEGFFDDQEWQLSEALGAEWAVHSAWQIKHIIASPLPAAVWIKVNTGMNRLGLPVIEVSPAVIALRAAGIEVRGLMTHFANADEQDDVMSATQLAAIEAIGHQHSLPLSCSNSAASLRYPATHHHRVRPGIMLYGSSPFADRPATDFKLAVTHRFSARVIALNHINRGDRVGYGGTWTADSPRLIAVVAVGYGDGYPRHAPSGTPVAIHGRRVPLVGRVSMDLITVDVTDISVSVGDEVELWGDDVSVDEVASHCGTISYELFCQITSRPERIIAADKRAFTNG